MKKQALLIAFSTSLLLLPFQNCSLPLGSVQSEKSVQSSSSVSGGQPYDGKPYIVAGKCPDGTVVRSRLMRKNSIPMLYRENCRTIAPRPLSPAEVHQLDSDQVTYNNQTYLTERPAIPLPGVVSWFIQLTGILQPRPASIYILDMFGNDAATIGKLIGAGHTVICSISAGTLENWNPDANRFAPADIGRAVQGGPGERWIDTRSANVRSILLDRLDLAKSKGCQGIEFDAIDGYANDSGFPLTSDTQIEYNQFLAFAAHDRALIMTLNGDPELVPRFAPIFDFAMAEQCFTYDECDKYKSFIDLAKPVLAIEYGPVNAAYCSQAKNSLISLAYFNQALDGSRYETCPK